MNSASPWSPAATQEGALGMAISLCLTLQQRLDSAEVRGVGWGGWGGQAGRQAGAAV